MTGGSAAATVVVIGAGQAGLSAAYHLQRLGFRSALRGGPNAHTFLVVDANVAPGGAWQHRWESLTLETVNGIFDLPDYPQSKLPLDTPSRRAVPDYFASFERDRALDVMRPVTVVSVARSALNSSPYPYVLDTTAGEIHAAYVINATGTWTNPVWPDVPGGDVFDGQQLHTRDYRSGQEFAGKRVAIVGGGISALQHLEEISRTAETFWYTRRVPVFSWTEFDPDTHGRSVIAKVTADVEAGNPVSSIVSYTGLGWSDYALAAEARGVLAARPMFTEIEKGGVREADGTFTRVDVILWATGFAPALWHLAPLELVNDRGGITMKGAAVVGEPGLVLIGYGPSQSTVGANRAGREVARTIERLLNSAPR